VSSGKKGNWHYVPDFDVTPAPPSRNREIGIVSPILKLVESGLRMIISEGWRRQA
jgi:hypothetical protein